jgi:hypothetical protein
MLTSWSTGTTPRYETYYEVPKKRVKHFIGREPLLLDMLTHFSVGGDTEPRVLILYGLGGQGKSQVALEYCRKSKKTYRGIFWINASSEASATRSFEGIASELAKVSPVVLEDTAAKIKFVKHSLENWDERWMLVFDNYNQPDGFPGVEQFMPLGTPCCDFYVLSCADFVLVASRARRYPID